MTRNTLPPGYIRWQPLVYSQLVEEGRLVRLPRGRIGTVMTERVQHNGVADLTMECEIIRRRDDPGRGSVKSPGIFLYLGASYRSRSGC